MDDVLKENVAAFRRELPKLLDSHAGKFVLMKDGKVIDFYPGLELALDAGFDEFGLSPFFVQKIEKTPCADEIGLPPVESWRR